MSPMTSTVTESPTRFPRVSGDEPLPVAAATDWALFSPRERG